jgi:HEAT repeat protein
VLVLSVLLVGAWLTFVRLQEGAVPAETTASPVDAAGLTKVLLEQKDDADPELVRRLANLKTPEALQGLLGFYDSIASLYMRRIAVRSFALFDGVPEAEGPALQKLTDVGTLAFEPELRETALDELAGCNGGRPFLAAIVASSADDAVRERALRHHVAGAKPEDIEWYQRIYRSGESKKKEKGKGEEQVYPTPLKELAFDGLAATLANEELVEAIEKRGEASGFSPYGSFVTVRRRALEELAARRAPETAACAEKLFENREERPDARLLAAQILLSERGPKFGDRLYKAATRGEVPLELAFGIADLLIGLDDPGLRTQAVKGLGSGGPLEKRFHLRMAVRTPDPKVDKALLDLSKDRDRSVMADALRAMGARGNPTFVPRLEQVLKESKDIMVLGPAIESLNRIRGSDPAWRAELAKLTSSSVDVVRNTAIEALGKSKDAEQLAPLIQALGHPSWTTRLAAARGLEELRLPGGVGALCERIGQEEGRMVSELAEILWRLTAQPFRADGGQWKRWWDAAGATFRFPTQEEFLKRQRERDVREEKQVSRSFRGVKVDSRFFGLRITSHHVAFVIDVSGSMEERLPGQEKDGKGPTRMEVARKELVACLEALEAGTRFNILPFSSGVTPWKEAAVECTEATFAEAKEFVEGLGALGGTNIHGGLRLAFDDPSVDTIFFLSDGEPSVGDVTDPGSIREEVQAWNKERGVVIHTISIGDRFPLLEWLATDSNGRYRTYP